jgi:hypothetical protein
MLDSSCLIYQTSIISPILRHLYYSLISSFLTCTMLSQCLLPVQLEGSQRRPPLSRLTLLQLSDQVIETETYCSTVHHSPGPRSKKGLSPAVEKEKADGCQGEAEKGRSSGRGDSRPTNNTLPQSRTTKGATKGCTYSCTSRSTRPECSPSRPVKNSAQQGTNRG